ncbi:MAG: GTP pyrophosphokinase family protein [Bacilli bacterium]|nr:GTP pyrophosphokinase family protein [Bacilli bacterium]
MDNLSIEEQNKIDEIYIKNGFALKMLETELDILLKSYAYEKKYNPVEHMKSRLKTKESAFDKLKKKGYSVNSYNLLKHVHDMIGIRIVCSFLSDVYEVVDLIKTSGQYKIKEEKDYIGNPKDTGYISYHIIITLPLYLTDRVEYVDAEIQVRTIAMDFWASLDHKLQYKVDNISTDVEDEIYNCSLDIKALDEKMNRLYKKTLKNNQEEK